MTVCVGLLRELERDGTVEGDANAVMRFDLRAHRGIYVAARNPYMEDTLVRYGNLATRIWCLFVDRLPGMAGHVGEHAPLLQAFVDGDATKEEALSSSHIRGLEHAISEAI
jgi:DNA-binding GntR family transcriptional regulator